MRERLAISIPTVGLITALAMAMFLMIASPSAADEDTSTVASNVGPDPRFDGLAAQGYLSSVAAGDNTWLVFEQTLPFPPFGDTSESRMEAVSALLASGGCTALPEDDAEAHGKKAVLDCSEPYRELQRSMAGDGPVDGDAATSNGMPPAGLGDLHRQLEAEADAIRWSPINEKGVREGQVSGCLSDGTSCVTIVWTAPLFVTEEMLAKE